MLTSKPRVVLWGSGEHARRNVLPALAECEDVQFVGITTRNDSVREEQRRKWHCKVWSSAEEMLLDKNIDVVYLATPIDTHFRYGIQILEAGKNLWCEKSLTSTLRDSVKLIEYSVKRNLSVCEVCMYQYHAQFKTIQKWLKEERIGAVYGLSACFGIPTKLSSSALLETGVYPLSAVLTLMEENPQKISSCMSVQKENGGDVSGTAYLNFSPFQYAFLEWGYDRFYRNELEIWGQNGLITAERIFSKPPDFSPKIVLRTKDSILEESVRPENHFVNMLSVFSRALTDTKLQSQFREQALRRAELMSFIMNNGTLQ